MTISNEKKNSVRLRVLCGAKRKHPPTPLIKGDYKLKELITQKLTTMNNKDFWSKILNIVITVLTAIATTFGVTSCIGM